ncbi:MAG: hypothetical protein KBA51_05435, partial [Kiritimatiellae bacterium]|nr:hypothetical protein [Kiritimatiellia bacterium]
MLLHVLVDLLQPGHESGNLFGGYAAAVQVDAINIHGGGLARGQVGGNLPGQFGGSQRQPG